MNRAAAFLFSLLIFVATSPADSTGGQGPTRAEVEATMGLPPEGDRVRGQMDTSGFPKILRVLNSQFSILNAIHPPKSSGGGMGIQN